MEMSAWALSTYGELRKGYGISMTPPSPPSGDENPAVDFLLTVIAYWRTLY